MKKTIALFLSVIMLLAAFSSCANDEGEYFVRTRRDDMGRLCVSLSRVDKDGKKIKDDRLTDLYEETCSAFSAVYNELSDIPQSSLCVINSEFDTVLDIPEGVGDATGYAFDLSELTDGLYEPCAGTVSHLIENNPEPSEEELADALSHAGRENFRLSGNVLKKEDPLAKLDLGPLRDAYALKAAVEHLKKSECGYGSVTFNGAAGVFGQKADGTPFQVSLSSGYPGTFNITEGYVSLVSEDFGHTFDFTDGVTEATVECAAVYSADPRVSCAMASLAYIYGTDRLMDIYRKGELSFEAALTEKDGSLTLTKYAERDGLFTPETEALETEETKEGAK